MALAAGSGWARAWPLASEWLWASTRRRHDDLTFAGRVESVAGAAGTTAVALPERADRGDGVAGVDGRTGLRRRANDDPERSASVVDHDAETIRQRRGRLGHDPSHGKADRLERLDGGTRRCADRLRQLRAVACSHVGTRRVEGSKAEVAAEAARHRDDRARGDRRRDRGVEPYGDPGCSILEKPDPRRIDGPEIRRERSSDRDRRAVRQAPRVSDRRDRRRCRCRCGRGRGTGAWASEPD